MTESNKKNTNDGISITTLLYNIVEKNTAVMTEICETMKGVEKILDDFTKTDNELLRVLQQIEMKIDKSHKILVYVLVGTLAVLLTFNFGSNIGWLGEILKNIVSKLI